MGLMDSCRGVQSKDRSVLPMPSSHQQEEQNKTQGRLQKREKVLMAKQCATPGESDVQSKGCEDHPSSSSWEVDFTMHYYILRYYTLLYSTLV